MGEKIWGWVWPEDDARLNIVFLVLILLAGSFLALFNKDLQTEQYKQAALVFLTLIFLALPIFAIDQFVLDRLLRKKFFGAVGLGKNIGFLAISLFLGFAVGLFLTAGNLSVTPAAIVNPTNAFFSFFYSVITAPLVEELFFRMTLFPILLLAFEVILTAGALKPLRFLNGHARGIHLAAGGFALVSVSLLFVLYHLFLPTAGVDVGQRALGNFIFSAVVILGNAMTRSSGFGLGVHIMTNLVFFTKAFGG